MDVPADCVGSVMSKLSERKGELQHMTPQGDRMRLEFLVPSRGLFGYRNEMLTDTRGEGIMNTVCKEEVSQGTHNLPNITNIKPAKLELCVLRLDIKRYCHCLQVLWRCLF